MTNFACKCPQQRLNFLARCYSTEQSVRNKFKPWSDPQVQQYIQEKGSRLLGWYEKVTGMDEVKMMQNRVLEAQDRFAKAQEARREMSSQLNGIKVKLREIQWELDNTTRGTDKYIQLIKREHSILQEEVGLTSQFTELERLERDCFALLSTSVRDSHEKERAQANKTRYWSIIGSVVGTCIGVVGSSLNNEHKMKQLRLLVQDAVGARPPTLILDAQSLSKLLDQIESRIGPRLQKEIVSQGKSEIGSQVLRDITSRMSTEIAAQVRTELATQAQTRLRPRESTYLEQNGWILDSYPVKVAAGLIITTLVLFAFRG